MNVHEIDNSASDLGKVVLWQYDKAYRLLLVIKVLQDYYWAAVDRFWAAWRTKVLSLATADDFGASVWAALLGVKRPVVTLGPGKKPEALDLDTFRKYLMAKFRLMASSGSLSDLQEYIQLLFVSDTTGNTGVRIVDGLDMSLDYEKTDSFEELSSGQKALFEQCADDVLPYPLGIRYNRRAEHVMFDFADGRDYPFDEKECAYSPNVTIPNGEYVCVRTELGASWFKANERIPAERNTSWDAVKRKFSVLSDPNRKIGLFSCDAEEYQEYKADTGYAEGDVVEHEGVKYVCLTDIPTEENMSWEMAEPHMRAGWTGVNFAAHHYGNYNYDIVE